jgi:pantothenate kinase-related protein Tda10
LEVYRDAPVPQEIEHLVKRCMAKQVNDRFASVEELAREIDCLIALYPWSVEEAKGWWKIHGEDLG